MDKGVSIINEQNVLGKDFKVYGTFENPLFLAKDVAEWIEYSKRADGSFNVSAMLASVDEDEKTKLHTTVNNLNGGSDSWFLTENGLYEVLMLSRKPIAKEFKKQVKAILKTLRITGKVEVRNTKSDKEIELANKELQLGRANLLTSLANKYDGKSKTWGQILDAYATKELTGEFLLPLPETKKTLSATEIGQILGISKNKVGSIANKFNLKTEENGMWVKDKAKNSAKEIETFRYYESAVDVFRNCMTA